MKRIIPILIGLTLWAPAQMGNFLMARIGDRRYAAAFANWTARTATPVLTPGVATVEVTPAQVTLVANKTMAPVAAGTPVKVIDGTTSEVVTPTSVNCDARGCTMTAIFAAPHPGGFRLGSADFGLEEAIRDAAATGGIVVVGPEWSGSTAQIVHASGQAGVAVLDERGGGEVAYRWNGTTYNPELSINAGGGVNIASPAVTPTSIEGVVLADQFCAVPGTLDQTCIAGALASIGSSAATLFVPTGTYAIGANLTIPANVHLHFAQGAVWDVLVPHIVTIEGTITAGSYQIFSTTLPATAQGAMTSGSSTLAISSGTFTGADVGSPVYVTGTGTSTAMVSDINRVIGIGDGTTTTFTAAAAMLPVNASSLLVWAGTCAGIDNGSGAFENFFGSSCNVTGAVNDATGAVSVTFSTAPTKGYHVMMGYQSAQHAPQTGTITAVTSGNSATVSFTAGTAAAGVPVLFGGSYVKIPGTINPAWWGAIGDGATDDYAALQAAMTACGESVGMLTIPAGVYRTSAPLDGGDPFQVGMYSGSGQQGGACNISGMLAGAAGSTRASVIRAAPGFPAGDFVLSRENAAAMAWTNFEVDANATGANGIDARWKEVGGVSPATSNTLDGVVVFNAEDTSFWLDNWNDAVIAHDIAAQERGPAPISFLADGGGGTFSFVEDRAYNGLFDVAAQNIGMLDTSAFDGVDFGGQAANYVAITGGQIFPNAATGVAIASSNIGAEGTEAVTCTTCWLTAGAGQVAIAGKYGHGIDFIGSTVQKTSGTPNLFGTVSSGLAPQFDFQNTFLQIQINLPAIGSLSIQGGNANNQIQTSVPWQTVDANGSGYGYVCLGTGACDDSSHYAFAGNGASLSIGDNYTSVSVLPPLQLGGTAAATGLLNLPNGGEIAGRNAANTADIPVLKVDSANNIVLDPAGTAGGVTAEDLLVAGGGTSYPLRFNGGNDGTASITVGNNDGNLAIASTGTGVVELNTAGQASANAFAGTCSMSAGTTCTVTIGHSYTTPVCLATEQGTGTIVAGECAVSGAAVTVTAATANSSTWGVWVFGDPN